jgi:hypothetical protein
MTAPEHFTLILCQFRLINVPRRQFSVGIDSIDLSRRKMVVHVWKLSTIAGTVSAGSRAEIKVVPYKTAVAILFNDDPQL